MKSIFLTALLYGIKACSGDLPVGIEKKPNLWRIRVTKKINQLETGVCIIALLFAAVLGFLSIYKLLINKRKIKNLLKEHYCN